MSAQGGGLPGAFNPLAGEEASTLGRLTILRARRNFDPAVRDDRLKHTGLVSLFMVFGEPAILVRPALEVRASTGCSTSMGGLSADPACYGGDEDTAP